MFICFISLWTFNSFTTNSIDSFFIVPVLRNSSACYHDSPCWCLHNHSEIFWRCDSHMKCKQLLWYVVMMYCKKYDVTMLILQWDILWTMKSFFELHMVTCHLYLNWSGFITLLGTWFKTNPEDNHVCWKRTFIQKTEYKEGTPNLMVEYLCFVCIYIYDESKIYLKKSEKNESNILLSRLICIFCPISSHPYKHKT